MKSIESKIKKKVKSSKEDAFDKPDIFLVNAHAPISIAFRVLGQILPFKFLVSSISLSFLLFCIPLGTLIWGKTSFVVPSAFLPILLSSSLFFCFYCLVLGIILLNTRIPFLTEWKEKLGFEEV
jgi:hypothetical protein